MKISILTLATIVLFFSCCDSKPVFLLGASGVIPAIVLEGGLATTLGMNLIKLKKTHFNLFLN